MSRRSPEAARQTLLELAADLFGVDAATAIERDFNAAANDRFLAALPAKPLDEPAGLTDT